MMSKKSPQLRFEGFTDDWELRKLGELLKSAYQGINTAGDKVIYSEKGVEILQSKHITSGYITFDDTRFLDKKRYSEYFPKYVPKKHDILFANIGTIGPSTVVETNKEFLIAWNILKMTPNENVNSKFIELFLQILNEKHYYEKITTGNATKFVNKDAILNIELCISSFKEQQKIGSFFQQLDETIALHQRKLDLLKEQKKGYLQKMFPKNGEKVPELRFAGFADDWELRKSKELCTISTGKGNTQDKVDDGAYPFYVRSATIEKSDEYLYDQEAVLTVGDGVGTGKVYHYVNGKYNLHQRVYRMYDFKDVSAKYFYYYFSKNFYKRVMSMTAKTSVDSVRMEMIADMNIVFPSVKEQENIVELFSNLDNTIALHQRKLDLLKEQKKGFLQKMFV
ncbi:restriction endonuclease subunit S [Lactococcus cremoris]|uniref:restriction endonuclease subunit S n=1 Tax=Lactococcus lactis subsp. cremoris TaxID=1359 RepID=UPI0021B07C3C|nr:restriction endonuclease subunit S [Lactococcus cremoris]MCT0459137.1 restriction endonuclease subunit S [Lactococcus cremoris]